VISQKLCEVSFTKSALWFLAFLSPKPTQLGPLESTPFLWRCHQSSFHCLHVWACR
jgi:hypothetical protein